MIATISLSYWVISKEAVSSRYAFKYMQQDALRKNALTPEGAGIWTLIWAYYCLLIHFLVFAFPIRAIYSIWDLTRSMKKAARSKAMRDIKLSHRRRGSSTSLSSSETLTSSRDASLPCSTSGSEAGDLDPELYADGESLDSDSVVHAVVIPNYKEEVDGLRETLEVLASHPNARYQYDVSPNFQFLLFPHGRYHLATRTSAGDWSGTNPKYCAVLWQGIATKQPDCGSIWPLR